MRNRTYGGVGGRKTKVGRKLLRFPPFSLLFGESFAVFGVLLYEANYMLHVGELHNPSVWTVVFLL